MAFLTVNFYAETLWMSTGVSVILPSYRGNKEPCQSIYLLHGGGGDHTYYIRHFPIEAWVNQYNLAVIMPTTPSRYKLKDIEHGEQWFKYASEELPEICCNMFNLSRKREDTFAMGASGGGYNALKLGLRKPERFGAVMGIYPALLSQRFMEQMRGHDGDKGTRYLELKHIFGDQIPPEDDAFKFLETAAKKDLKTKLYICCGTDDVLHGINKDFQAKTVELGFDSIWDQRPGGHDGVVCAHYIQEGLKWLPLKKLN